MSTVNFSVPEELKEAFNRTFEGQNKSAVIAGLMRDAIEQAERKERARAAFEQLTARRPLRGVHGDATIQAVREELRADPPYSR
ncbi:MAG: hypothetical protein PF501_12685 [Salinisphaera sp.]|jgi:hypothetical protein|nr:hypothetical protein [Salinisphaera sp.]